MENLEVTVSERIGEGHDVWIGPEYAGHVVHDSPGVYVGYPTGSGEAVRGSTLEETARKVADVRVRELAVQAKTLRELVGEATLNGRSLILHKYRGSCRVATLTREAREVLGAGNGVVSDYGELWRARLSGRPWSYGRTNDDALYAAIMLDRELAAADALEGKGADHV